MPWAEGLLLLNEYRGSWGASGRLKGALHGAGIEIGYAVTTGPTLLCRGRGGNQELHRWSYAWSSHQFVLVSVGALAKVLAVGGVVAEAVDGGREQMGL